MLKKALVTPAGFEPATCPLGGGCSIQLSHGAVFRPAGPCAPLGLVQNMTDCQFEPLPNEAQHEINA